MLIVILLAAVAYFLKSISESVNTLEQNIAAELKNVAEAIKAVEPVALGAPVMSAEPGQALESSEEAEQKNAAGKPSTGVSPQLVAAITGAIAVYLDDRDMERHTISSIQATT